MTIRYLQMYLLGLAGIHVALMIFSEGLGLWRYPAIAALYILIAIALGLLKSKDQTK